MRYLTVSGAVRRVLSFYLIPYVLVLLSIAVVLHPIWLRQFPRLNLYKGDLFFSGARAVQTLEQLAADFNVGQPPEAQLAAALRAMGLPTSVETFEAYLPTEGINPDLFLVPMLETHQTIRGNNVVAFSPGSSPVTVLLLAHRDPGSSDALGLGANAGGSAALIELARVLSSGDHFYSYLFVSSDVAQMGMEGAQFLLRNHPDLNLRVAISLDGLGNAADQRVALYNAGVNRRASPLWTLALAREVLEAQGMSTAGLHTLSPEAVDDATVGPLDLLASLINQHGLGARSISEGESFLKRGDAVLAVSMVTLKPDGRPNPRPTAAGVTAIDPTSLLQAGRFIEAYVRSLDLNQFDSQLLSRLYVVFEGQYLPAENVSAFGVLIQTAFVLLALLPFFDPPVEGSKFANFFERELPWLSKIGAVAVLAGLVWQLPRFAIFRVFPAGVYLLLTVLLVVVGGAILVRRRLRYLMLWRFAPTVAHQRRMLVLLLLVIYLGFASLFSPFTAGAMLFVPFLVWAAVRFTQPRTRNFWLAVFGAWTVQHVAFSVLVLYAVVSRTPPWAGTALAAWFLCALLWLVVLVYVFSTPPLGVIERK